MAGTPAAMNGDYANGAGVEVLPVTKIPALDTIDPYAVERPVGDAVVAKSPALELLSDLKPRNVAKEVALGYARFISQFTGLEDVAFIVDRDLSFVSEAESPRLVICASVFAKSEADKSCSLREVDYDHCNRDEIQFALELRCDAGPENGEQNGVSGDVCTR